MRRPAEPQEGAGGAYGAVPIATGAAASAEKQRRGARTIAAAVGAFCAVAACAYGVVAARRRSALIAAPLPCDWSRPDVVVVGGGAAGSVAAARLVDARLCVAVLEAGGPYRGRSAAFDRVWANANLDPPATRDALSPLDVPRLWGDVAAVGDLHWPIANAVIAKVLGGCGAHNAMLYVRATPDDVARWDCGGWDWESVEAEYDALAAHLPSRVAPSFEGDALAQAFLETATASGLGAVDDFNDAPARRGDVAGPFHVNVDARGRRASAYSSLLEPRLLSPRLRVVTGATVRRLIFDGGRCVGVEYGTEESPITSLAVGRRASVVLAAGALNTPRVLLASGVGPGGSVVDAPGVGRNLQDHPAVALTLELSTDAFFRDPGPLAAFLDGGDPARTLWASPGTSVGAFVRSRACGAGEPADLQLTLFSPGQSEPHLAELLDARARNRTVKNTALVTVALLRPDARHSVRLNASDVHGPPILARGPRNEAWYAPPRCPTCRTDTAWVEDGDADRLLDGVEIVRGLAATDPLRGAVAFVDGPPEAAARDDRRSWIRTRALANSHWVGTCAMGDDDADVLDGDLRVRGLANVVVADASAIPLVPNGNVHSTVLVFARRAAATLLGETKPR